MTIEFTIHQIDSQKAVHVRVPNLMRSWPPPPFQISILPVRFDAGIDFAAVLCIGEFGNNTIVCLIYFREYYD